MDIEKKLNEIKKSFEFKGVGADGVIRFVASKQIVDRDGDIVYSGPNEKGKGILTDEFDKNPVFLDCHDAQEKPIGKIVDHSLSVDSSGIPQFEIGVVFAETDDGQEAKYLYENGFMSAVSIRFRPVDYVYNGERGGYDVFTCRLYEVSAVSLPANQEALIIKGYKAQKELEKIKAEVSDKVIGKLADIAKGFTAPGGSDEQSDNHAVITEKLLNISKNL